MKTKFVPIVPLFAVFGLLLSGCVNQQVGYSQAYRAVPENGDPGFHRAYAYDPFYYYSGSIFAYRDFYGYARPPFYVSAGPYQRFGDEDDKDETSAKRHEAENKSPFRLFQTKKPVND